MDLGFFLNAGFPSSLNFGSGGQSYSNFLASTVDA